MCVPASRLFKNSEESGGCGLEILRRIKHCNSVWILTKAKKNKTQGLSSDKLCGKLTHRVRGSTISQKTLMVFHICKYLFYYLFIGDRPIFSAGIKGDKRLKGEGKAVIHVF